MSLFSSPKDTAPPKPVSRVDAMPQVSGGTFIGPNITIEGTITGSEPVSIEGTVKGKISLSGTLHIGTKARVEATVHAKNVTIEGRLNGDVSADDKVELIASANVDGNIKAPKIIVAEGAKFRGSVDMGSAKPREAAEPATAKK
jgi:cytoskeletal protein CcmA (bactofilin family)